MRRFVLSLFVVVVLLGVFAGQSLAIGCAQCSHDHHTGQDVTDKRGKAINDFFDAYDQEGEAYADEADVEAEYTVVEGYCNRDCCHGDEWGWVDESMEDAVNDYESGDTPMQEGSASVEAGDNITGTDPSDYDAKYHHYTDACVSYGVAESYFRDSSVHFATAMGTLGDIKTWHIQTPEHECEE
jgi:hypothetical protein